MRAWKSSPGPLQTEWQTQAASGEGPAGTFACVRADAAHRLAASIIYWRRRNQRAEASPEPRLRVPSAGRPRLARPRRPVSPSRPSTERPSAPASRGRPPACWRRSVAALRRIREGCLRRLDFSNPPECPQLLAVTNEQLRNGARTVTADNILSTRVQRKARGSSVAARAPGRLAQREEKHLRRPRTLSCGGREAAGVALHPRAAAVEATLRGAARAALPERNRRPTWLILPVAYACLKD